MTTTTTFTKPSPMGDCAKLGVVQAIGAAQVLREAALLVQPQHQHIQPFGFVELADFVGVWLGSIVEIVAPLFVRRGANSAAVVRLFVRVDMGEWTQWPAPAMVAHSGLHEWLDVGLSTKFVVGAGCLCSLSGNGKRLPLVSGGAGLIEWGCQLGDHMTAIEALPALIKVWR